MKKTLKISIIIIILFLLTSQVIGKSYMNIWEQNIDALQMSISHDKKMHIFNPRTKTNYRNKIFSLFTSMGINSENIKILRLDGYPGIDFLFYKEKLYSVTEDWYNAKFSTLKELKLKLINQYGKPTEENRDRLTVLTYKKKRTVVILYEKKIDEYTARCKVYFYSKNIFNTLFKE